MSWQITPLADGLGAWRSAWDELNIRFYQGHPFSDSRFVETMLRYFGAGAEHLCVHRTEGRTDGMLILYPRRAGVWTQFVPAQAQAAPVLIENPGFLEELFPALPRGAWLIELLCQDASFSPAGLWVKNANLRTIPHALTMNIELDGSFEEYWSSRPKKLGQNLRRYRRQTGEDYGTPELRINVAPGMMRDAVARYGNLEASGWKGEAGTAVSPDNVQGQFYSEVMALFAETGQAEVVEYWLGERLAASRLIVLGGTIAVMLKTTYDENLAKFAPGRLLLKDYLKHAFAVKQSRAVEFYTDATPDQLAWATGQRHIYHAMFFRSAYLARMHDAYLSVKNRISDIRNKAGAAEDNQGAAPGVRQYECVGALPPGCAPLFLEGERHSFDLSADWFRLLENKAIFPEINARYYTLERDKKVLGLLPLSLQHAGGRVNQVSGLNNFYSSLYRPLLVPSVTPAEMATCLKKIQADTGMDVLRFNAMDTGHPGFTLLESAIHQASLKPFRFFCFGNWYLPVEGRSFAEYFQGLASKVQSTIKRREKKFLADGRGRLEIVTGGDKLNDVIEAWDKIYRTSWKVPEPFPEFVPGLIRMCAGRGWLRLGFAYYDGEPIAAQLWIVSHGRAAIYKLAYDEKFSQLSPGTVLTAHLMRHVLDVDKVVEVDYLVGDDAYKKDWMSHRRERWGIVAYNPYTLGGVAGIGMQIIGKVRKSLLKKISARTTCQPPSQSIQQLANCNNAMRSGEMEGNSGWTTLPLENNLGSYKEIWDKLNAELYSSNPYFDSSFIEPLLAHFSAGRVRICIFRRGNEIDGLVIVVPLRFGKWSLFVPAQAQIVPILVRYPESLQSLIHALPGLSLGLDLPCQDPLYSASFDEQPLLWGPVQHAHTMGVKLDGDFKNYWGARSANLRKSVGRRLRKAQDAGFVVRLNRLTEPGDMQSVIARFGEMESAGWKGRGGSAVHADNVQGYFYTDVLRRFAKRGKASVYELYFNDALVAMQLCIASPSMLVLLKTTYDESQADYSPGRLLLYLLLEEEFAAKRVQEIEFYTNADSDGLAWATHDRWISHYMLFSNSFFRKTYQALKSLKH